MNGAEAYISLAGNGSGHAKPERIPSSQAHSFTPLLSAFAGDRWRKGSDGIFTQVWTTVEIPQGEASFKIRVAADPAVADDVLRAMVPIVVEAECPFKVIANTALLELAGSKWASEDPAGDFMTVYPASQALFDELTEKLRDAVRTINDSHIPLPLADSGRVAVSADNPWPGLDFYLPNECHFFFGCEEEQVELAQRIERASVTVVVGDAGVGKSSLVRAGLKPFFERVSMEPVYLRLRCGGAVQPVQQVRDEINRVLAERKIDGAPFEEGQTLRDYFHAQNPGWIDADGKALAPVLIFDQFEELLGFDDSDPVVRRTVEAFWTQVANQVDNRGREAGSQSNRSSSDSRNARSGFKVVISLRQDHLPKLLARRGQMPSLTQNHFLLTPFNGWKAVQAVTGPGRQLLDPDNFDTLAEQIVRRVGRETTQPPEKPVGGGDAVETLENLRVDPALLSFFCQQLNEARKRPHHGEPRAGLITVELVAAEAERIFEDFLHPVDKSPNSLAPAEPRPDVQASELPAKVLAAEPQATVQATEPQATVLVAEPQATVQAAEPQATVQATEPQATVLVAEPQATVQAAEPQATVQAAEPKATVQAPEPKPIVSATEPLTTALVTHREIAVPKEPDGPKEQILLSQMPDRPGSAPIPVQIREKAGRRLKRLAVGVGVLSLVVFAVLVAMYVEELQREQTEVELEEYISNNAAAKNTFELAHKKLTLAESNLALKESNLLALIEQTREQEQETRAAQEQYVRLAGEETNFQSRITQLNGEKAQAESRLSQWSGLLNDLTNQIADLARQKRELEARNHALTVASRTSPATNHSSGVITDTKVPISNPPVRAVSTVADDKEAAAMQSIPVNLPAVVVPEAESSARRNASVLLIHGQCLYLEEGTNFHPLELHHNLRQGTVIETGKKSWCDLFIRRAGITVRLAPESEIKIAKLSLASENGVPVVDTLLELPYGRMFTVVRALVPGSTVEISDGAGRSVIECGGLGSYMITAPRPDVGDKLSVTPLRVVGQQGASVIAPGQEYSAKDGVTFSLDPSRWETTLIHLDELEAEADRALGQPETAKTPNSN